MSDPTPCYVCGTMVKGIKRTKYSDGDICIDCMTKVLIHNRRYNKTTGIKYGSAAEIKELIAEAEEYVKMPKQEQSMYIEEKKVTEYRNKLVRKRQEKEAHYKAWLEASATKSQDGPGMSNKVKCPKCGCESVSGDKKGFGVGKAVVGSAIAGPIGLMAGNIGAKKVRVTCLKCGHNWMAG